MHPRKSWRESSECLHARILKHLIFLYKVASQPKNQYFFQRSRYVFLLALQLTFGIRILISTNLKVFKITWE